MPHKNPDDRKDRRRKWYLENRDRYNAYQKKWRDAHRESRSATLKKSNTKWRTENKQKWMRIIKYLGMDKCSICGYDKCFRAIDFHHINPDEKERNPCREMHYAVSISRLMEFDRCIAVCSNCHREIHDKWVANGIPGKNISDSF